MVYSKKFVSVGFLVLTIPWCFAQSQDSVLVVAPSFNKERCCSPSIFVRSVDNSYFGAFFDPMGCMRQGFLLYMGQGVPCVIIWNFFEVFSGEVIPSIFDYLICDLFCLCGNAVILGIW